MDQRSSKRRRTILDGRIVFNNRFSLIECTVRDLSDSGARIAFAHPIRIPQEFEIEIPNRRLSRWARVMWSNGKEYGITFVEAPEARMSSSAPPAPEEAQPPDGTSPAMMPDPAKLQEILDDAQRRIAEVTGSPPENIRLKLEIDVLAAGLKKH